MQFADGCQDAPPYRGTLSLGLQAVSALLSLFGDAFAVIPDKDCGTAVDVEVTCHTVVFDPSNAGQVRRGN